MKRYSLYIAWLVACFATLCSLYYSDIRNLEPCHLCWYQRICLFPLIILLGLGAYRGFLGIARYTLPQVIIGFCFALYQIGIQEIPGWNPINMCGSGPSCADKVSILGPITIPMCSTIGFIVIGFFLFMAIAVEGKQNRTQK